MQARAIEVKYLVPVQGAGARYLTKAAPRFPSTQSPGTKKSAGALAIGWIGLFALHFDCYIYRKIWKCHNLIASNFSLHNLSKLFPWPPVRAHQKHWYSFQVPKQQYRPMATT